MRLLFLSTFLVSLSGFVTGQTTFEVASIKANTSADHAVRFMIAPGGRFVASNVSVKMLMQQAFGIKDFQITGGPGWISSDRYDISAKPDESTVNGGRVDQDQMKAMVQALLAERFKLTYHKDTKEMPIYALVVAKNGPKIHASEAAPDAGDGPDGKPTQRRGMMRMGRGQINADQIQMQVFVNQLSMAIGRAVVDKTGLKGNYDIKLEWTPEAGEMMRGPGGPGGEAPPPASDSSGPTIFTAIQEQLGLKLEPEKGPVEIFVIDRVEKPSEN